MKHVGHLVIAGFLLSALGCDALLDFVLPSTVSVSFVNESPDFDVEVAFIFDDEDDIPEFVLRQLEPDLELLIGPGDSESRSFDCDDLQAMIIDRAELQAAPFGPDSDTDVLRIDDDYECGDEIVFTFTHTALIVDFDVSIQVRPFLTLP